MLSCDFENQARRISHCTPVILTSSPAFSSYSNHSPSDRSMPANLVPESRPVAKNSPSALNSVNSRPLQSNSRMLTVLGGSLCSYIRGAALMLAECSLCHTSQRGPQPVWKCEPTLQFLHFQTKLASPLLPLTSFCSKRLTETRLG